MPELPSGRHVALMPTPLDNLLKEGRHFGNIHKVLAIKSEADLARYVDVLYLVPASEAGSQEGVLGLNAHSLPLPPGMGFVPAGFKLSEWEENSGWSEADRAAFSDFLAGRCAPVLREWLDTVKTGQAKLHEADDPLTRLLVAWWDAGCHPAQEEGWDASDVGSPDWDDYDLLAALGQACKLLPGRAEIAGNEKPLWMLQSYWNIVRFDLQPRLDAWPDASVGVREAAVQAREHGWLEDMNPSKRDWLHDNGVSVCIQIWTAYGDRLRAVIPQPYGIIELVVLSPEANRIYIVASNGEKDAGHSGQ
ncbi:MAG: hypothetical protein MOGDAGHF_00719 [Rhodocyclaceae bacterium]|nr:hypothetical protein [Rhodocyclaceae bacterium]